MSEKKDDWERLIHLPDEYEADPSLTEKVKKEILQSEKEKKNKNKPRFFRWLPAVAGALIAGICIGYFVPKLFAHKTVTPSDSSFSSEERKPYLGEDKLVYTPVNNIKEFIEAKNLSIHYYFGETVTSKSVTVIDTEELAFISQDMMYIDTEKGYFDQVNLKVQLLKNAEFDAFVQFDNLPLSLSVDDISVTYSVTEKKEQKIVLAKFVYEETPYFMEIKTNDETGKIEQYIDLLLSKK